MVKVEKNLRDQRPIDKPEMNTKDLKQLINKI